MISCVGKGDFGCRVFTPCTCTPAKKKKHSTTHKDKRESSLRGVGRRRKHRNAQDKREARRRKTAQRTKTNGEQAFAAWSEERENRNAQDKREAAKKKKDSTTHATVARIVLEVVYCTAFVLASIALYRDRDLFTWDFRTNVVFRKGAWLASLGEIILNVDFFGVFGIHPVWVRVFFKAWAFTVLAWALLTYFYHAARACFPFVLCVFCFSVLLTTACFPFVAVRCAVFLLLGCFPFVLCVSVFPFF